MEDAKSNPIVRKTNGEYDGMEVSKTEDAVKDNQTVKKCLGFLSHDENDHWYICPQYNSK